MGGSLNSFPCSSHGHPLLLLLSIFIYSPVTFLYTPRGQSSLSPPPVSLLASLLRSLRSTLPTRTLSPAALYPLLPGWAPCINCAALPPYRSWAAAREAESRVGAAGPAGSHFTRRGRISTLFVSLTVAVSGVGEEGIQRGATFSAALPAWAGLPHNKQHVQGS